MKTYVYKLKNHKKNKILFQKMNAAGYIWNFLVRRVQRHRRLFYRAGVTEVPVEWAPSFERMRENQKVNGKKYAGKVFAQYRVYNFLQRLRHTDTKIGAVLREIPTSAIQQLTERLYRAFKLFFTKLKRGERFISPVNTKNPNLYPSFTLKGIPGKGGGYSFNWDDAALKINFLNKSFRFFRDRQPSGTIKTLTVKRDNLGDVYVYAVSDETTKPRVNDKDTVVGVDVWLNPMLTLSDGQTFETPTYLKDRLSDLQKLDRLMGKKREAKKKRDLRTGEVSAVSNKYKKVRAERSRLYRKIIAKRRDYLIKTAKLIATSYGAVGVPDVPLKRLQKKMGFRIGDLAYAYFVAWLEQFCLSCGTQFVKVPVPKKRRELVGECHACGEVSPKSLIKSEWVCQNCGAAHNRELNAAKVIEGITRKFLVTEKQG